MPEDSPLNISQLKTILDLFIIFQRNMFVFYSAVVGTEIARRTKKEGGAILGIHPKKLEALIGLITQIQANLPRLQVHLRGNGLVEVPKRYLRLHELSSAELQRQLKLLDVIIASLRTYIKETASALTYPNTETIRYLLALLSQLDLASIKRTINLRLVREEL